MKNTNNSLLQSEIGVFVGNALNKTAQGTSYNTSAARMDGSLLEAQLATCTESFLQLCALLSSDTTTFTPEICDSRQSLLQLIVTLNSHMAPNRKPVVGVVGLAPRVFDRAMDLAIIVETSSPPLDDPRCRVCWLHPRSILEFRSAGVWVPLASFMVVDLKMFPVSSKRDAGDRVRVRTPSGIWKAGTVSASHDSGSGGSLQVLLDDGVELTAPSDEWHVRPMEPVAISDGGSSSGTEDDDDDENAYSTLLPSSRYEKFNSSVNDHVSVQGLQDMANRSYNFGSWERHTKGFGSKMLARMGYKRGSGLGQSNQGIIMPVEAATVLPERVALDFIHEHSRGSEAEDDRPVRRRRKKSKASGPSDHTMKINASVSDFLSTQLMSEGPTGSVAGSVQYIDRVEKMRSSKLIAESLGLNELYNSKLSVPSGPLGEKGAPCYDRAVAVATSSASRLNRLEEKERDVLNRVRRLREGLQRNEHKDKKAASAISEMLSLAEKELLAIRKERDAVSAFKDHNRLKQQNKKDIKKVF